MFISEIPGRLGHASHRSSLVTNMSSIGWMMSRTSWVTQQSRPLYSQSFSLLFLSFHIGQTFLMPGASAIKVLRMLKD